MSSCLPERSSSGFLASFLPGFLLVLGLAVGGGCAPELSNRPPAAMDPIESLKQEAKKLDFAIVTTKRMIQRSRGAEYLPDLYMRLAELYTERARYAWLVVYEQNRARGDRRRAIEAPEARLLKNLAVGVYDRMLREFPRYKKHDQALFLLAHEYRELGEFDQMKATYERLIEQHPKSPHRLEAYLVLGDTEFDKNDLARAEHYYNLVLVEPEGHVHPLARYKLAWVRINKEDCKTAARLFERILRDKATPRGQKLIVATQRKLNIRREALVDLAYCFPEVQGDKVAAAPYFKELADSSSDYMAAMRRAANRFFIKQMYAQGAAALREVLAAAVADDEAVESARKLYDNVSKGRVYAHAATDVEYLGRVLEERFHDQRLPQKDRDKLAAEFEVYARDIATKAHLAANEAKAPSAYANAAAGYNAYLDYFGQSQTLKRDIEQNRAEALLGAEKPYEAGRAYEKIAQSARDAATRKQAQLNAVSAYQRALEQGGLSRLELLGAWGGIRTAGAAFIAENPGDQRVVPVKFSIARSHYDAGDYARSAHLFYALARQYPTTTEAVASGHLALDALRVIEDFETLIALGQRMAAEPRLGDAKFKNEIKDIVAKTVQRQVTELTIAAGADRDEKLLSMAKRHKGSGLGEQALYNALIVARDRGDIARFYELGDEFVAAYPRSGRRTAVLTALAQVASDRADFAQAARYLDAAYAASPADKESHERLYAAASIHAFLGSQEAAGDIKRLVGKGSGAVDKIDELLVLIARSGNFAALEDVLRSAPASSATAEFLRGYLAFQRNDFDGAAAKLAEVPRARGADSAAGAEAIAKARFLLGEIAFDNFTGAGGSSDLAQTVQQKKDLLGEVDKAYAQAIGSRQATWALAALARVSDAYTRYATFLRELKLPDDLSAEDKAQVKKALESQADDAARRAADLRGRCAKRARELLVFSELVRSCLTGDALPDKIAMFPRAAPKRGSEPPQAAQLRQALLKDPKGVDKLIKLAELYLGAGDLGMTLLILDRAEELDSRSSDLHNLRGVALQRSGDPDGAYAAFYKAVQMEPGNARARLNLAAHLAFYGHVDRAQAEVKKAGGAPGGLGEASQHPEIGVLGKLGTSKGGKK